MSSNDIRIKQQEQGESGKCTVKPICVDDKNSLVETCEVYRLQLSQEEYGQLMRRALMEGCSPEELVARTIQQLAEE